MDVPHLPDAYRTGLSRRLRLLIDWGLGLAGLAAIAI